MTGRRITVKRGIKRGAGLLALAMSPFVRRDPGTACILMYHRLAPIDFVDQRTDDWNVTPAVFEGHMRMLAEIAAPVPLHTLRPGLIGSPSERPRVAVTFDDGYASVCRAAVPILVRYGIPATLFVTTAFVGTCEPMPFDRWGTLNRHRVDAETWLPAGWADIEQALSTGLISIGSHSHRHLEGRECSSERCAEEANRSRQELHTRLGCDQARTYAYPFGSSRHGDVTGQYRVCGPFCRLRAGSHDRPRPGGARGQSVPDAARRGPPAGLSPSAARQDPRLACAVPLDRTAPEPRALSTAKRT